MPSDNQPVIPPLTPAVADAVNSEIRPIRFFVVAPALSFLAFAILFFLCGTRLELQFFEWTDVAKTVTAKEVLSSDSQKENAKPSHKRSSSLVTQELASRLFWGASAIIFQFLAVLVIAQAIRVCSQIYPLSLLQMLLIVGAVALLFFLFYTIQGGRVSTLAGGRAGELLLATMEQGRNPAPETRSQTGDTTRVFPGESKLALKSARQLAGTLAAVSKVGLVAVALTACVVLWDVRRSQLALQQAQWPSERQGLVRSFEKTGREFINLLQLTAATLVAGVIEVYLLYYVASFHSLPVLLAEIRYYGQVLATVAGIVYSGMLLSIYLPCVAGQRELGEALLQESPVVSQSATPLLSQLKDPMTLPTLKSILTIISPIIAAALTHITSALMEHLF